MASGPAHLNLSRKQTDSMVTRALESSNYGKSKIMLFPDDSLTVDFATAHNRCGILYLAEEEIALQRDGDWLTRLQLLKPFRHNFAIVEKTPVTEQFFNKIQLEASFGQVHFPLPPSISPPRITSPAVLHPALYTLH